MGNASSVPWKGPKSAGKSTSGSGGEEDVVRSEKGGGGIPTIEK
jgi:hypothetical protein